MGFNTCNINCGNLTFPNHTFVLDTARAFVRLGLREAGFQYINMDDGWQALASQQRHRAPDT